MESCAGSDTRWCALYTAPRHEKKVAEQLAHLDIEHYVPTYRTTRRWNNGCRVQLDLPLFPTYLFARVSKEARAKVLSVNGVHWIIKSGRDILTIPEPDMDRLRHAAQLFECEPHPYLSLGDRVRIKAGPLAGTEGILLRKKKVFRVVIAVDVIMKAMSVEIDADLIELVNKTAKPSLSA